MAKVAEEEKIFSVTAVESLAMLLETVKELRMPATTVAGEATSPETARSPKRRGSRCATTVARPAMWPATVTTPMSRSVTLVEDLDTFRKAVKKSSATGVARSAMLLCSAVRRAKSTATTAANPVTWQKNAPSRPLLNPISLVAPPFF